MSRPCPYTSKEINELKECIGVPVSPPKISNSFLTKQDMVNYLKENLKVEVLYSEYYDNQVSVYLSLGDECISEDYINLPNWEINYENK
jgi:hypothetical protein